MKISQLKIIKDACLIELEEYRDERGAFARQFCKRELKEFGIDFEVCQCNISKNYKKNVLRGLHYQKAPHLEQKIVYCPKGGIYDVIVDLRPNSTSYLKWEAVELTEDNNKMLYIPPLVAHGFQTLVDNTLVFYQMGNYFEANSYAGLRYNDPKIGIKWKACDGLIINERDKNYDLL